MASMGLAKNAYKVLQENEVKRVLVKVYEGIY